METKILRPPALTGTGSLNGCQVLAWQRGNDAAVQLVRNGLLSP